MKDLTIHPDALARWKMFEEMCPGPELIEETPSVRESKETSQDEPRQSGLKRVDSSEAQIHTALFA